MSSGGDRLSESPRSEDQTSPQRRLRWLEHRPPSGRAAEEQTPLLNRDQEATQQTMTQVLVTAFQKFCCPASVSDSSPHPSSPTVPAGVIESAPSATDSPVQNPTATRLPNTETHRPRSDESGSSRIAAAPDGGRPRGRSMKHESSVDTPERQQYIKNVEQLSSADRISLLKQAEDDNNTYRRYINKIETGKLLFESHHIAIRNKAKENLVAAVHDLSVLADTVQFYVKNKQCCASLEYIAKSPFLRYNDETQDFVKNSELERQGYCDELDKVGKRYKQNGKKKYVQRHRNITESLVELNKKCKEVKKRCIEYEQQKKTGIELPPRAGQEEEAAWESSGTSSIEEDALGGF
jgi:hypothetical protein